MIFKFLSSIFDHVEKQLDYKNKINFKTYYVSNFKTNIAKHITQYLKKYRQSDTAFTSHKAFLRN